MPITRRRLRVGFDIDGTIARGSNRKEAQRNVRLFQQLSQLFEQVYIISARGEAMREHTERNLRDWGIRYRELILTERDTPKVHICIKYKIDIMIEDDLGELSTFESYDAQLRKTQVKNGEEEEGLETLFLGVNTGWNYADLVRLQEDRSKGRFERAITAFFS